MKILGIIAEYNPFHNGHAYQLAAAKKKVEPDYTIAVMSGNFLQRGEIALFDKYTRTKMAVLGGVDAVYELPAYYACSSAEEFATAAVLTMKQLSVTHLAFGAECNDLHILKQIASAAISENTDFTAFLKAGLAAGETYAKAYSSAVCRCMNFPEAQSLLAGPNNILAICYLKAIFKYCPNIQPVLIPRKDSAYHDTCITGAIASASAIRQSILQNDGKPEEIIRTVPDSTLNNIIVKNEHIMHLTNSDFATQLRYCLLNNDVTSLSEIYDISRDLANRMKQNTPVFMSYEEIIDTIKTKKYTHTRITRALTHLLLNMQQDIFDMLKQHKYIFYVRLLGVSGHCTPLIKYQKTHCSVPWIQKVSTGEQALLKQSGSENKTTSPTDEALLQTRPNPGVLLFQADIYASNLYRLIWHEKYGVILPSDYETNALIL